MTKGKMELPRQTKGDTAYAMAKAGLSAIPGIGGPAVELFQMLIQPPLERRRDEWMALVGEKLQELENRGVDIKQLGKREEFVSAVMHASQIALRTHQAEKRDALRNAVFNIASGQSPGEALEYMFFDWIDSMSVLHIQILRLFQNPIAPPNITIGGLDNVLEHNMPALRGSGDVYRQIWRDLYSRGLLNTNSVDTTMSAQGLAAKRTTDIGDKFVRFITEPML